MAVFSRKELEYLQEQDVGRLATVSMDQSPHVTPVAFAADPENLYVNIHYGTKKARNIRDNPKVSFVVDDTVSWKLFRAVLVNGTAELMVNGKLYQIGRNLIANKYEKYRETSPREEGGYHNFVLVIAPTQILSWGI
jgi:pyridoxamine 5'-phosphate oxidase family protein